MKVYAIAEKCEDDYYPDYTIVDNRVYLKEEDAKKRLEKLDPGHIWQFEIYVFEVEE